MIDRYIETNETFEFEVNTKVVIITYIHSSQKMQPAISLSIARSDEGGVGGARKYWNNIIDGENAINCILESINQRPY